jgi:hypothetical protein
MIFVEMAGTGRVRLFAPVLKGFSRADVAQMVEHSLGKGEVTGSIPVISSRDSAVGVFGRE